MTLCNIARKIGGESCHLREMQDLEFVGVFNITRNKLITQAVTHYTKTLGEMKLNGTR